MKFSAVYFAACLLCGTASAISSARTTPVEKVVILLKDLKGKIEQDAKEEAKVYDKYACWCENMAKKKASAIETAHDELRSLGQGILKLKGTVAVLGAEMDKLTTDMDENTEAQATATSIREREHAAYDAETTEMKEALAALQKAIIVLSEGTALVQEGIATDNSMRDVDAVRMLVEALPTKVTLKQSQVSMLSEFVTAKGKSKYAPQSLSIQGILRDMYETFSSDLQTSTNTEASSQRTFEDLIAVKTAEFAEMKSLFDAKEVAKADSEEKLATTTQSYDDTMSQKDHDIAFFDETKAACENKSSEWNLRKELRTEELAGIDKALEILTTDDARALFKGAIKAGKETGMVDSYDTGIDITSFLQVRRGSGVSRHAQFAAYDALKGKATALHSLRLGMLAVQVRQAKVGHFDEVIKAINNMITTLKEEDAADIAKRDECIEEYKTIDSKVANMTWLIEKNVAKIDKLESQIEASTAAKTQTIEDIETVKEQIATMTAEREAANLAFKNTKTEDQDAIALLLEARAALSAYYENRSIAMGPVQGAVKGLELLTSSQGPEFEVSEEQAPDAIFSGKGKRKNEAKGIVQLLTSIIEDLNDEIKNGMKNEEAAQLEYEGMLKAAQTLQASLEEKKTNLEVSIANDEEKKSDEHELKLDNMADLKGQKDYKAAITDDCDFILRTFTKRAEKRQAELSGLSGAKEFLAGYDR